MKTTEQKKRVLRSVTKASKSKERSPSRAKKERDGKEERQGQDKTRQDTTGGAYTKIDVMRDKETGTGGEHKPNTTFPQGTVDGDLLRAFLKVVRVCGAWIHGGPYLVCGTGTWSYSYSSLSLSRFPLCSSRIACLSPVNIR